MYCTAHERTFERANSLLCVAVLLVRSKTGHSEKGRGPGLTLRDPVGRGCETDLHQCEK